MKKYFIIAFVILVILLLVLRKQTEPTHFKNAVTPPAETEAPVVAPPETKKVPVIVPPTATPAGTSSGSTTSAANLTPESVRQIRSVAKNSLAGSYSAQASLRAEWNRYSSDLVYGGWTPPTADLAFKMGFMSQLNERPVDEHEKPERFTTDAFINSDLDDSSVKVRYTPLAEKIRLNEYAKYCEHGCVANTDSYELLLVYPLDEKHVDVWTINEKKELKQVHDGTLD